jgi:hypothetical protein
MLRLRIRPSVIAHDRISGSPQMVAGPHVFLRYAKSRPGVTFLRKDRRARSPYARAKPSDPAAVPRQG